MSSHRDAADVFAAEKSWRELAARADYDPVTAARLLQISLRQLERECQRELGCTPTEWFQRERMATAARLLADRKSVKEVAFQLGYTLPANFSRDFKRRFGRTPRAFAPRALFGVPFTSPVLKEGESEEMR